MRFNAIDVIRESETAVVVRHSCACKNEMPDVDLASRHPALQSMCSKD